jgi:hypothetical protein
LLVVALAAFCADGGLANHLIPTDGFIPWNPTSEAAHFNTQNRSFGFLIGFPENANIPACS